MEQIFTGTEHIFRNPLKINVNGQNHAFRLQFFQYMDLVRCNHSQFLLCQGVSVAFGMGLIILAMILHIVNALRSHDVENAWFDANGINSFSNNSGQV